MSHAAPVPAGDALNDEEVIRWVCGQEPRTLAVVGLSDKPDRASHSTAQRMRDLWGYRVEPVNPVLAAKGGGGAQVLGRTVRASLADTPAPVDVVQVFRASEHVPPIAREAIEQRARLGIQVFWMQEGVHSDEAVAALREAGIRVVSDRCTFKEARRLRAEPRM